MKTKEPSPSTVLPLEEESLRLLEIVEQTKKESEEFFPRLVEDRELPERAQAAAASFQRTSVNLTKALRATVTLGDELNGRIRDLKKQNKKRPLAPPANAAIDYRESQMGHFAGGINAYKLLLICFAGSFLGVVVELLWCLVTNGYLESRSGLVYGPFNLLYGVGAVALSAALYRFRNRSPYVSFLGGMLVGSVVEYLFSWGQEMLFGSTSWDYSHLPFHLNGRICLMYSVFWGVLGVLWMKNLYPRLAKWILKLPERGGKCLTWILLIFFVFNALVSSVAVYRWNQRREGVSADGAFWQTVDERFPDERMERIYANMKFE